MKFQLEESQLEKMCKWHKYLNKWDNRKLTITPQRAYALLKRVIEKLPEDGTGPAAYIKNLCQNTIHNLTDKCYNRETLDRDKLADLWEEAMDPPENLLDYFWSEEEPDFLDCFWGDPKPLELRPLADPFFLPTDNP